MYVNLTVTYITSQKPLYLFISIILNMIKFYLANNELYLCSYKIM